MPGVEPLSPSRIERWKRDQERDEYSRRRFLCDTRSTQQKIVDVLVVMEGFIEKGKERQAHRYFSWIMERNKGEDTNGVSWAEVRSQIWNNCFGDEGEWGGFVLLPRRVASQITVFKALMDLDYQPTLEEQLEFL